MPSVGVKNVGLVNVAEWANTKLPVPVSSVTAVDKFELVGVAKKL